MVGDELSYSFLWFSYKKVEILYSDMQLEFDSLYLSVFASNS